MRFLREPLVQFLVLGGVLFLVFELMGRGGGGGAAGAGKVKEVVVDAQRVALLRKGFELDMGKEPTAAEMQKLIDNFVREEILVREARALGLDQDDTVVRRRLVQSMEFRTEPAAPTEGELREYFAGHAGEFKGTDGRVRAFEEVKSEVMAAWMAEKRKEAIAEMYAGYRKEYRVVVENGAATMGGGK